MIKVKKVYNNNVLLGEDNNQIECILIGKGIGFGKKFNEEFAESQAEKKFILQSPDKAEKFNQLLQEIPVRHLELSNRIINKAQDMLGIKFKDCIYLGLTDHINYAIERCKEGIVIRNALLWQVKQFYPREFDAALQAIELIALSEGVELPEDEAGFIAMHFVNAQQEGEEMKLTVAVTKAVKDILKIVQIFYKISLDEKSLNYCRFVTHIQYFVRRLNNREQVTNLDDEMFEQVKKRCPDSYLCTCKVKEYLEDQFKVEITQEEMLYFMLHINRVAKRSN